MLMPRIERLIFAWLATLTFCACRGGPPPDRVRLELPEQVLSSDPLKPTVHVRRGGASVLLDEPAEYSVMPAELAAVAKNGTVTCLKSGDGRLAVSVQGVKTEQPLRCRLVDRIELGTIETLDVSGPPVTLDIRVLDKTGKPLADVPVTLRSESPRLLGAAGNVLTPVSVGATTFTVAAGTKERKVPARIVRTLTPEALPIEGGRRISYSLPEGKFEVTVTFPTEKTLTAEWRGAPYCSYRATSREHHVGCVLQGKGGVVIDNPAFVVTGATEVSGAGVTLREVP